MKRVVFYEKADDELLRFAVIAAKYQGQWVLCRHKARSTWEFPGGHRETGETIEAAAVRELYEETGAAEYRMAPVGVYSVTDEAEPEEKRSESFGMLFYAEITRFDPLPSEFEMEKTGYFETPPDNWTYPEIQPVFLKRLNQEEASEAVLRESDDLCGKDGRSPVQKSGNL